MMQKNPELWTSIICECGNERKIRKVQLIKHGAKYCSRNCFYKYKPTTRFDISNYPVPIGVIAKEFHGFHVLSDGTVINKAGKKISTRINCDGYTTIAFYADGKYWRGALHRLLAICFIPNPENKPQVNHIDCNKQNNSLDNLEWATQLENMRHAYKNNLIPPSNIKGVVRLDDNRKTISAYSSLREAGKDVGVHCTTISHALKRNIRAGGFYWKYNTA